MSAPEVAPTASRRKARRWHGWGSRASKTTPRADSPALGRPLLKVMSLEKELLEHRLGTHALQAERLRVLCVKLNSDEWERHAHEEMMGYAASGLLAKAVELFSAAQVSSYIQQKRGAEETQLTRLDQGARVALDWCATATHERNRFIIPFTMAARSVVKIGRKTTNLDWSESKNIVSKPMAIKIVGRQTELREPPKFVESRRVVVYVYDQLYRVDDRHHKQRIGTTALQRVMGTGEESEKKHQVHHAPPPPLPPTPPNPTTATSVATSISTGPIATFSPPWSPRPARCTSTGSGYRSLHLSLISTRPTWTASGRWARILSHTTRYTRA